MIIIIIYTDDSGVGVKFKLNQKEFSDIISIYFCTQIEKDKCIDLLSNEEKCIFTSLKYEKRINSFLQGKISSKKAIGNLINYYDYKSIEIKNGVFSQPYVVCDKVSNVNITISHSDKLGVAVAFSEKNCVGIDVEEIDQKNIEAMISQCTEKEMAFINNTVNKKELVLTAIWCSKEALSKIIKTGLTISLEILELENIKVVDNYMISQYTNFHQYKCISWRMQDEICSLVLPKELLNDNFIKDFQKFLKHLKNLL